MSKDNFLHNELKQLGYGGGLTFIGDGIRVFLEFLCQLTISRMAGPAIMGIFAISLTITNVLRTVSQLGFDKAFLRFIPIHHNRKDEDSMRGLIHLGIVIPLLTGVFLGGSLYFFSFQIGVGILNKPQMVHQLRIFAFCLPFVSCLYVIYNGFVGMGLPWLFVLMRCVIFPGVMLFFIILMIFLAGNEIGPVKGYFLATVIAVIIGLLLLQRKLPLFKRSVKYNFSMYLNFSVVAMFVSIFFLLQHRLDILIAGYFSTPSETGIYFVATRLSLLLFMPLDALAPVFSSIFSSMYDRKDKEGMGRMLQTVTRWALYFVAPATIILVLFSDIFLSLFGPEFVQGQPILILMSVIFCGRMLFGPAGNVLMMIGRQKIELINSLGMIFIYLVIVSVLARTNGIFGIALAYSISIFLVNFARSIELYILIGIYPLSTKLWKIAVASGICFLIVFIFKINLSVHFPHVVYTLLSTLIGSLTFLSVTRILGYEEEDRLIWERIKLRIGRGMKTNR